MTALADKMRQMANTGHPRATELRERADALDSAAEGFMCVEAPRVSAPAFLSTWAKARLLWCECSKEALV